MRIGIGIGIPQAGGGASSGPALAVVQSFAVDSTPSTLGVITVAQSFDVQGVGATTSVTALDPLTIAPGWTIFLVGDVGLSDPGTMTWSDQSGNNNHATMATGANKPAITPNVLNGRTGITFDDTVRFLAFSSFDVPAPGTTPAWLFSVWNLKTWTNGNNLYAASSTSFRLRQGTSTPQIAKTNGTVGANLSPTLNTWQCSEDYYSNSAADYLRIGAASTAAANSGNTDPASGTFRLGSSNGGGLGSPDADMVCFGLLPRLPTGTEISNLRAWVAAWYGGTVAV